MTIPRSPSHNLPPDDLPPEQLALEDYTLRRQLDVALTQRFQESSNITSQEVLSTCEWSIKTITNIATLVIVCPDKMTNWKVLNQVIPLGNELAKLSKDAKLRIYATPKMLEMFEIRVDELSVYQGPL
ncbi:MAG: hypothetical protein F6K30_08605 [Cyanothece sp. SIO2G6]|nr:hypothetical protein [Cyanothece sp. SIO2G6]